MLSIDRILTILHQLFISSLHKTHSNSICNLVMNSPDADTMHTRNTRATSSIWRILIFSVYCDFCFEFCCVLFRRCSKLSQCAATQHQSLSWALGRSSALETGFLHNTATWVSSTCHRTLCAVQVLKIRRPNYFDFSVKTMVTMKLFQQQNGTTCFIIVLKVSFMWKYANDSIKEMKWWIITILFYFTFPFIKYKHCNIVTIPSVRGRLILSTCTAHTAGRHVRMTLFLGHHINS